MESLKALLTAIVDEAAFDLNRPEISPDGSYRPPTSQRISAEQLREIYFREEEQAVEKRGKLHAPENLMSQWVDSLRGVLEEFIDPETDKIGLGFPTQGGNCTRTTIRADGFTDKDFESSLQGFAEALVQAAAIIGVGKTVQLLAEWKRSEPIRFQMCTVLNGLSISAPVSPRDDIRVVPVGLDYDPASTPADDERCFSKGLLGSYSVDCGVLCFPGIFSPAPRETRTCCEVQLRRRHEFRPCVRSTVVARQLPRVLEHRLGRLPGRCTIVPANSQNLVTG